MARFWHMQLHPGDPQWGREEELLKEKGLIGLGDWDEKKGQIESFITEMAIGDIVAVKRGECPIALVEVVGDCEVEENPGSLDWFKYRRKVKILDDKPMIEDRFPAPRGTLTKCVAKNTRTFKYIQGWLNMIDSKQSTEENRRDSACAGKLNVLLYGPPGTGKTYHTIFKAVEICDGKRPVSYEDARQRFEELKDEGRVEFVTFHQSYGYEEFIEGIRAETHDGKISYKVRPGLLREMVEKATKAPTFDAVYNRLDKMVRSGKKVEAELTTQGKYCSIVGVNSGGSFLVRPASDHSGKGNEYPVKRAKLEGMWPIREKLKKSTDLEKHGASTTDLSYYWAVLKLLEKIDIPYVLIIDEINRGNISKIFGELITLIEEEKRGMEVRLPFSGKSFGVPKNLYIIGTMNTADRSIAMMDTALRRRFVFEEMMPNPCLLHLPDDVISKYLNEKWNTSLAAWENISSWDMSNMDKHWAWDVDYPDEDLLVEKDGKKINLRRMLHAMNKRIEVLYDREHMIGHAYFMRLKEKPDFELLKSIFEHKIIPLLAEYFFEDWGRIRLVLGDNQKQDQRFQFITEQDVDGWATLFGEGKPDGFDWDDRRKVHARNHKALKHPESYIGIYDPACCKPSEEKQEPNKAESVE